FGAYAIDEVEIGVGVEEVLGDRAVGAGPDLAHEVLEILGGTARLGMHFGIGRHFDLEPVAAMLANQAHQFVSIMHFTRMATHARRQVATQGNNTPYALRTVTVEN